MIVLEGQSFEQHAERGPLRAVNSIRFSRQFVRRAGIHSDTANTENVTPLRASRQC
jgi:hypothetical protein